MCSGQWFPRRSQGRHCWGGPGDNQSWKPQPDPREYVSFTLLLMKQRRKSLSGSPSLPLPHLHTWRDRIPNLKLGHVQTRRRAPRELLSRGETRCA